MHRQLLKCQLPLSIRKLCPPPAPKTIQLISIHRQCFQMGDCDITVCGRFDVFMDLRTRHGPHCARQLHKPPGQLPASGAHHDQIRILRSRSANPTRAPHMRMRAQLAHRVTWKTQIIACQHTRRAEGGRDRDAHRRRQWAQGKRPSYLQRPAECCRCVHPCGASAHVGAPRGSLAFGVACRVYSTR